MSSTVTNRTRALRAKLDEAERARDAMLEAIDEWAEATYRYDQMEDHCGHLALLAHDRVRAAEGRLLAIYGREQAW